MRVFLLSCLALVVIAVGAYAVLEGGLRKNAGDAFAVAGSVRINNADKPSPSGILAAGPRQHGPDGRDVAGRPADAKTENDSGTKTGSAVR